MTEPTLEPAEAVQAEAPAVPGSPTLDQAAAAVRQILLAVGGWAVGRGYLEADTLAAIITVALIVGPLVYGQWRTRVRSMQAHGLMGRK